MATKFNTFPTATYFPDPYHLPMEQVTVIGQQIEAAQSVGVIPKFFGALPAWPDPSTHGTPPKDGPFKPYRDNSYFWNPSGGPKVLIFPDRGEGGKIRKVPAGMQPMTAVQREVIARGLAGIEWQPVSDTAEDVIRVLSEAAVKFMGQYGGDFGGVQPALKFVVVNAAEGRRLSFNPPDGTIVDYPLGEVVNLPGQFSTFPSDVALRFALDGETIQCFKWQDYAIEHPTPVSAGAATTAPLMSNPELANAAEAILGTAGITLEQKGARIRAAAK